MGGAKHAGASGKRLFKKYSNIPSRFRVYIANNYFYYSY
jgi:hypothetical protein